MKTVICDACGQKQEIELAVIHNIIPEDIATIFDISDSPTVALCVTCSNEIRDWYRGRVSISNYDERLQRFSPKSRNEISEEYQTAYLRFLDYKGIRNER